MEITIELNEKEMENYKLFKEGKIALKKENGDENIDYYIFMYKNMLVVIVDDPYIIIDQKKIDKIAIEYILGNNDTIKFNCEEKIQLVKNKIFNNDDTINIYYYIDDYNIIGYGFEKEKLIHFLTSLFYKRKKINSCIINI